VLLAAMLVLATVLLAAMLLAMATVLLAAMMLLAMLRRRACRICLRLGLRP
jgi:hypothetical protein